MKWIQLLAAISIAATSTCAHAQFLYDFHSNAEGNPVLATLEISSFPARHPQIVSLSFTPEGDGIFGFGSMYDGTFSDSFGLFDDDQNNGLNGQDAEFLSDTASVSAGGLLGLGEESSLLPISVSDPSLTLGFGAADFIRVGYRDMGGPVQEIVESGRWLRTFSSVPEPAPSISMLIVCCLAFRKQRRTWMRPSLRYAAKATHDRTLMATTPRQIMRVICHAKVCGASV